MQVTMPSEYVAAIWRHLQKEGVRSTRSHPAALGGGEAGFNLNNRQARRGSSPDVTPTSLIIPHLLF